MNCMYKIDELNQKYFNDNCNGVTINEKNYIVIIGSNNILLSAPHAVRQKCKLADMYTGAIVEYIARNTGSFAIIRCCNLNDNPNEDDYGYGLDYKNKILDIIEKNNIKYFFDIHGCKNYSSLDIDLGTNNGKNICKETTLSILLEELNNFDVKVDKFFKATNKNNISRYVHDYGKIDAIQIEISKNIRKDEKLLDIFINRFINVIEKLS